MLHARALAVELGNNVQVSICQANFENDYTCAGMGVLIYLDSPYPAIYTELYLGVTVYCTSAYTETHRGSCEGITYS